MGKSGKSQLLVAIFALAHFCVFPATSNPLTDNDELFLRTTFSENNDVDDIFRVNGKIYDDHAEEVEVEAVADPSKESQPALDKICLTKGCVKVAARVIDSMDDKIDPCDDFYQFACGGFQKNTFIPPEKSSVGEFSTLRDKLKEKMILMLEDDPDPREPKIFESVRNIYKSCMDTQDIEENSVNDLKNLLKQVGGYPVVEGSNWDEHGYSSNDLALKLDSLGLSGNMFVSIGVTSDSKNSTRRVLYIGETGVGLSRENILKGPEDDIVKAYLKYLIDTAKFLGASDEDAEKEMKELLDFKIKIAKIKKPQEYWRNRTASYNLMTLRDVARIYPSVQWVDLFNKYFDNENITINENEEVIVSSPSYLNDIQDILANTSARVKANFQISDMIPLHLLSEEALKIEDEYDKVVYGINERKPRWKTCLWQTGSFGIATSAMYIKKHFGNEAKEIMQEMVDNILNEFITLLNEIDWLDEETRKKALEKAHLIHPYIGYPEELMNNTLVDEQYEGLHIAHKGLLQNNLAESQYYAKKRKAKFREPIKKNDWANHAYVAEVNAYYSARDNSIEFPAGILAGAFFGTDRPLYMDYGAIGLAIGHEITHGFDDKGSQFNGHGNMVNWWDPETKKKYLERTRCVIEEYGNYTMTIEGEEFHLNGVNTQGENIADIGGIKEAYRAYQRLAATFDEPEGVLPGLPYTTNQLFWIASADVWCSTERPQVTKQQILTGSHTPDKFRINGPFSNLEEFAKDWKCPIGSKMNPAKKCHVW